jgi:protein-S-isoprenylcysteine O-methyltransferase Ste14
MREYAALIVLGSWSAFLPMMIARLPGLFARATHRNVQSIPGIMLVACGFAFVWARVTRTTPPFALAPRSGALLAIVSSALGLWAILTLGRQWSVQARLRADHRLVTAGPYGWVRHPVYTAFLGLLIATGLVFAPSVARLLVGILFYLAGTAVRIRSEDLLLHERFGKTFDDYARRTPALIPYLRAKALAATK